MRPYIALAFAVAVAVVAPASARAQSGKPVAIGERVRLTTTTERGRHRPVGRVIAVSDDSIMLDTGPGKAHVAIPEITGVDVSGGRRTNGRRGMAYGLLAGAGVGAIVGASNTRKGRLVECTDCLFGSYYEAERGTSHLAGAIIGGVYGVVLGGVVGRFYHTERWINRPLGKGNTVGLSPTAGRGLIATVAVRF